MIKFTALAILFPCLTFAASLTNDISGVGPNGAIKPYICIQNKAGNLTLALAPGQEGDANKASGNKSYAGATLRFEGCAPHNTYLGYIGFLLNGNGNNSIDTYQPPEGVHIAFNHRSIDSMGHVKGAIEYTPIAANFNLEKAAKSLEDEQFKGINLSGLEFDKVINPTVIPNLSDEDKDTNYSDLKASNEFIKAGVNTIRLPLSWSFLQLDGAGKGGINLAYFNNYVRPLLQSLTSAQVNTIVDLHAYMRYSKFGEQYSGCPPEGGCPNGPEGQLISDETVYKQIWGQVVKLIQSDPKIVQKYIMLDLMNEPVDVPDDKVFTIQASLIKMLREQKFEGYILVEGNAWSGLHSWSSHHWQGADNQTFSNATLFTRENFFKQGISDLSKIIINVHQYLDSNYSGTQDDCLQDLTTIGDNGFNLSEFVDYLSTNKLKAMVTEFGTGKNIASCQAPLKQFMLYLQDNSAKGKEFGFLGWTLWSSGHGWGSYKLRVEPSSYQMDVLREFL
ncbi:MAG: cellulase family glycosylhydrolase [Tatlockia sp.]|nr:cellulase family glycosylhydrolase [Tatlockia sp.]